MVEAGIGGPSAPLVQALAQSQVKLMRAGPGGEAGDRGIVVGSGEAARVVRALKVVRVAGRAVAVKRLRAAQPGWTEARGRVRPHPASPSAVSPCWAASWLPLLVVM